jgi:hypothetical protein
MLDGFNEGWLAFEGGAGTVQHGSTSLDAAIHALVARTGPA